MKLPVYYDYAAATPVSPEVLDAMKPYLSEQFYNPSASYLSAQKVGKDLLAAHTKIAHWFGCRPAEVIFTAGGTEANNLAIHGVMSQFPESKIAVSAIEHESVLEPASQYDRQIIPTDKHGIVEPSKLGQIIDDSTVLVSIMYANNEIGSIQPIRQISQILDKIRTERRQTGNKLPLYFHTDACQAAGFLDLHTASLGVDMMTINSGKIYGPKQVGALYVSGGTKLKSLVQGGGQERNLRSGTENVAGAIGLAEALDNAQNSRHDETKRLQELQNYFIELLEKKIPQAVINGSLKKRLPNNIHVTIPGEDNERLLVQLDEAGILAAAGSACSASNDEPSHVLKAIGLSDAEAQASLRFSMGATTDKKSVEFCVSTLASFLA